MKDSISVNDFQVVTRFENFGGGWGYSGHSVEAIRFMADTDIILLGFGMYGGRGGKHMQCSHAISNSIQLFQFSISFQNIHAG